MNLFFEESGDFKVGSVLSQAGEALGGGADPIYSARRCLSRRHQGTLLVTEVFLPAVLDLLPTMNNDKHSKS